MNSTAEASSLLRQLALPATAGDTTKAAISRAHRVLKTWTWNRMRDVWHADPWIRVSADELDQLCNLDRKYSGNGKETPWDDAVGFRERVAAIEAELRELRRIVSLLPNPRVGAAARNAPAKDATADAFIEYARRVKHWPMLETAVDCKLNDQVPGLDPELKKSLAPGSAAIAFARCDGSGLPKPSARSVSPPSLTTSNVSRKIQGGADIVKVSPASRISNATGQAIRRPKPASDNSKGYAYSTGGYGAPHRFKGEPKTFIWDPGRHTATLERMGQSRVAVRCPREFTAKGISHASS